MALLRGVNVGGHRRVPMAGLRALLAGLGYPEAATYLQSGNAVFTAGERPAAELAAEIERAIERELGLAVPVLLRTAAQLRAVIDGNPLPVGDPSRFAVWFLPRPADPRLLDGIDPAAFAPEEVRAGGQELYLSLPDGLGRARLPQALGKRLREGGTVRNWRTVLRLRELAEAAG